MNVYAQLEEANCQLYASKKDALHHGHSYCYKA